MRTLWKEGKEFFLLGIDYRPSSQYAIGMHANDKQYLINSKWLT
jgi:hypothetical protein